MKIVDEIMDLFARRGSSCLLRRVRVADGARAPGWRAGCLRGVLPTISSWRLSCTMWDTCSMDRTKTSPAAG